MSIRSDERAQAIQVGAVLLFGALVVAFASYQAVVVPDQNRGIEFNHNKQVQEQLQELRNGMLASAGGQSQPVTITLGTRYPSRLLAINPGPATGSLRTSGTSDPQVAAWINNSVASGEPGDYWDGTNRSLTTGSVVYQPNYNVYTGAPTTVYENTVLANEFRDTNVTLSGQRLIRDERITLVTVNGSLSVTQSGSVSPDPQPTSASRQSLTITNDTDENVTIAVATRLSNDTWADLLSDEVTANGGHVQSFSSESIPGTGFNRLQLELEPGPNYRLQLSRVGIGRGVQEPDAAYLTDVVGNGSNVAEGGTQRVVLEVRDRFNNPVSGVEVNVDTDRSDSAVTPASRTTDGDGHAAFIYEAPGDIDGADKADTVRASFVGAPGASFDADAPENASVSLTIDNADRSGTGAGGGGGGAYDITFDTSQISTESGVTCSGGTCEYNSSQDADGDGAFNLTTTTSPTVIGATVDFGLNTSSYGEYTFEDDQTDGSGEAVTTFRADDSGGITSYVASGGSSDSLEVAINVSGEQNLITAVEPDPDNLADSDGEFVRLNFSSPTDTTDWTLADDDGAGQNTTLPSTTLDGTVYFARNPSRFATYWGIDQSSVYRLDTQFTNTGDPLWLNDSSGNVVDQFAYESATTTNGWSVNVGTAEVAVRKTSGGSFQDTDSASDWRIEDEETFFADGNGGFRAVRANDILPDANSQNQSFSFRLDSDMPSTASLDIIVDDAQKNSWPRQVDYSSADLSANTSVSNTNINAGTDTATLEVSFSNDLPAGTAIRVAVDQVNASSPGNQDSPYDVTFQRSDVFSNGTGQFSVDRNNGTSELQTASVEDVRADIDGQTQNLTFTLDSNLASGETVTVDLSDAQETSGSTLVDYGNRNNIAVTTGSGFVQNANVNNNGRDFEFEYVAGASDNAGNTIEIEIDGVNVGPLSAQDDPYEMGLSRSDADTRAATFDVVPNDAGLMSTTGSATTIASGSGLAFELENTGSRDVTITDFRVDTSFGGSNISSSKLQTGGGDPDEVRVVDASTPTDATKGGGFDLDNTSFAFQNVGTAEPVVASGETPQVRLRDFSSPGTTFDNVVISDRANANLRVTFTFGDGTSRVYYLEARDV